MRVSLVLTATFLLAACGAHNPMNPVSSTDTTPRTSVRYPASNQKVFVTEQSLPPSAFEPIANIDVGKNWYGGSGDAMTRMANRARELGADAVIQAKTWMQPSGFSWAAPHGSGLAVRLKDLKSIESGPVPGSWY